MDKCHTDREVWLIYHWSYCDEHVNAQFPRVASLRCQLTLAWQKETLIAVPRCNAKETQMHDGNASVFN